jgi:hypothetical protein
MVVITNTYVFSMHQYVKHICLCIRLARQVFDKGHRTCIGYPQLTFYIVGVQFWTTAERKNSNEVVQVFCITMLEVSHDDRYNESSTPTRNAKMINWMRRLAVTVRFWGLRAPLCAQEKVIPSRPRQDTRAAASRMEGQTAFCLPSQGRG